MSTLPIDLAPASTRHRVLDLVRGRGRVSRVEIAATTGLTPSTISNTVRDLVDAGLVREAGRVRSAGGSPRRLLELQHNACFAVGVQMDRCTCSIVLTDFAGRVLATETFPGSGDQEPDEMLSTIASSVVQVLETADIALSTVLGVGMVTHGPQDQSRGVVLGPRPGEAWRGHPITTTLAGELGLPVLLENDATAATLGQQWLGGEVSNSFGLVYMASGLGGGVVVAGEVFRGSISNSVELGHITLDTDGAPCACGNRGCVEGSAGTSAIVARAVALGSMRDRLHLAGTESQSLADFERIAHAALSGDPEARALMDDCASGLGHAATTLLNLFGLDTIVLAGPAFAVAGPILREGVQAHLDRAAFSRELRPTQVRLSEHGSVAAAVGGALLVLRSPLLAELDRSPSVAAPRAVGS